MKHLNHSFVFTCTLLSCALAVGEHASSSMQREGPERRAARAGDAAIEPPEVYGFSIDPRPTYKGYDWSILTAVGWNTDAGLVAMARRHVQKKEAGRRSAACYALPSLLPLRPPLYSAARFI